MKELESINEIETGKVVLDFYSTTCVPCKRVIKMLENDTMNVLKVNVEEAKNASLLNRFSVQAVPTLILLNNNEEVIRANGIGGVATIKAEYDKD